MQSDLMIDVVHELRTYFCSLQTYGIVQQEGQVEYMTFVLSVEEDGPAYMAGLRPGTSSNHVTPKIFALGALSILEFNIPTFPTICQLPFTQVRSCSSYPSLSKYVSDPSPFPLRFLYFLHSVFCSSLKWVAEFGGFRGYV